MTQKLRNVLSAMRGNIKLRTVCRIDRGVEPPLENAHSKERRPSPPEDTMSAMQASMNLESAKSLCVLDLECGLMLPVCMLILVSFMNYTIGEMFPPIIAFISFSFLFQNAL